MCETNDSLPVGARVWPPCDSSAASDIDEVWDDSELLAHYEEVELQVRAQVEAFRAGRAAAPSRRRRKNHTNRTKRKEKPKLEMPGSPLGDINTASSSSCPLDEQQAADPTAAASGLSPVYPWILPSVELPSEFLTLQQSAYTSQCCRLSAKIYFSVGFGLVIVCGSVDLPCLYIFEKIVVPL
ncbi:unnamed protein product [Dibothriocephalus latus]|uniref:Uncharacterized protein n=1 Tax=Dibothriocephalus latus TaxID=60516 RepID=A0A3P7N5G8_DIBLA|nr:unnamed protein product [Dibothriocephalus latus]